MSDNKTIKPVSTGYSNHDAGNSDGLKWQRELQLYKDYKTTLIIDGNVIDETLEYIQNENKYIKVSLDEFLDDYFSNLGYKNIIFFNMVDGFYNPISEVNKGDVENKIATIVDRTMEERGIAKPQGGNKIPGESESTSKFTIASRNIRNLMINQLEPVVIILKDASRYIVDKESHEASETYAFAQTALGINNTTRVATANPNNLSNLLIVITDKNNDVPPWFFNNHPLVQVISIPHPNRGLRQIFVDHFCQKLVDENQDDEKKHKAQFVDLTGGFSLRDLESLVDMMVREGIPLSQIQKGVTKFKYGIKDNPWEATELFDRVANNQIEERIANRVKGQEKAVKEAVSIIRRSVFGLSGLQHSSNKSKPKGILFMAGPTGVGKTELAKSIAEAIFGDEDKIVRFDMSEYSLEHSDQRLLGAPPGYVGYSEGGQLTNAVKENPFSVLLFDEIEKANPLILDKFLQILEDGRMTDGKGETVHFSETFIIFTSNIGTSVRSSGNMDREAGSFSGESTITKYGDCGCNETDVELKKQKWQHYHSTIMDSIRYYFDNKLGRPELRNRIGQNFIVFNYISLKAGNEIFDKLLNKTKEALFEEKGITLELFPDAYNKLLQVCVNEETLKEGGRGIGNHLEKRFLNSLALLISKTKKYRNCRIDIKDINENGDFIGE